MGFFLFIAAEEMVNFPICMFTNVFWQLCVQLKRKKVIYQRLFGGSNVMETDLKGKTSERAEVDLVEVLGRL